MTPRDAMMPEAVHLELPAPPSLNRYWIRARGRKALTISAPGRAYKEAVWMVASRYRQREPTMYLHPVYPTERLAVTVRWFRRLGRNGQRQGDLDNRLKVLLDALQHAIYTSDGQIVELHAYRCDVEEYSDGKVIVDVSVAPTGGSAA